MTLKSPDNPSSDYSAMRPYWDMVDAVLGGAVTMRAAGKTYLPKFEKESDTDYEARRKNAPFTNIYGDISRNLASRPFAKQLDVGPNTSDMIKGTPDPASKVLSGGFIDDVDGHGNGMHVFANTVFKRGIDFGIDWVLVDYQPGQPGALRTVAEEKAMKLKPYWVHIPAKMVLASYVDFVDGEEIMVHARIDETSVIRDGYGEKTIARVRVLDRPRLDGGGYGPATWELFEKQQGAVDAAKIWVSIGTGAYSIGIIPLVPYIPGMREGSSFVVDPPLRDLAYLQVEEFQQESNLKYIKEMTAFPMLVGEGVVQPTGADGKPMSIPIGPKTALFAPPNPDGGPSTFRFIEPAATSLRFLEDSLAAQRKEMRDLGYQPITEANLTVITTANLSRKASSAVQAWAIKFKDFLETCLGITGMWLNDTTKTTALVHTDFAIDVEDSRQMQGLALFEAQGILSKELVFSELRRRAVISDESVWEVNQEQLAGEQQGLAPETAATSPASDKASKFMNEGAGA